MQTIRELAQSLGYTVSVFVTGGPYDFEGWVKPDTDYDSKFAMFTDDGEVITVYGWNCITEEN